MAESYRIRWPDATRTLAGCAGIGIILEGLAKHSEAGVLSADLAPVIGRIILNFSEEEGQSFVAYSFETD